MEEVYCDKGYLFDLMLMDIAAEAEYEMSTSKTLAEETAEYVAQYNDLPF